MKPTVTWILIADGAQARVLEHAGPGKGLTQVEDLVFSGSRRKAREIMADRPGRSFASAGTKRSAMEPRTDPVEHEEAEFVRGVAEELEQHHARGAFQRLIVAAAPNALGDLRPVLSNGVREAIVAELAKDLTNVPTAQLDKHFSEFLPV
ncbi:Protein required for attachment to host cells [Devosia enhydra]|uniref:Protein required for attachment to host cells n=1 Tax=Devosia enhydra TaxID=665118 RepID=A0A1K2HVQ3_9HYPH|nr:host attachment protein [Devosia enhydra]SFZ82926.1 Protein required for attachment to host cells [Devosia enhydra]